MKSWIIILSLVAAGLTFGWWKSGSSARRALDAAHAESLTLSNQLAEAGMKLTHQERLATVFRNQLVERAQSLVALSNVQSVAGTELARSRAETAAAKAEMRTSEARAGEIGTQRDKLAREVELLTAEIEVLRIRTAETLARLAESETQRAFLQNDRERLRAEKAELVYQLNDPDILRQRIRALPSDPPRPSDQRMAQRLALQPDGSVSAVEKEPGGQP